MSRHQRERRRRREEKRAAEAVAAEGCSLCRPLRELGPEEGLEHCCGWVTEHQDGTFECDRGCDAPEGLHPVGLSCGLEGPCERCRAGKR